MQGTRARSRKPRSVAIHAANEKKGEGGRPLNKSLIIVVSVNHCGAVEAGAEIRRSGETRAAEYAGSGSLGRAVSGARRPTRHTNEE